MKTSSPKPTVMMMNPTPTTAFVPYLVASLGTAGVSATMPTVAGRVASPAWIGLMSSVAGSWKNRLSRYMKPLMAAAPMRMPSVAPTSFRFLSSARSTSGAATVDSTLPKATSAATSAERGDGRDRHPAPVRRPC